MPSAPAYTDTVLSVLANQLGPDAVDLLACLRRRCEPGPDPIRAALADHLHAAAREASRIERDLREHMARLHDFLARVQHDLALARTPSHWEVVGISGTAIDQAAARFGEVLERLAADATLYTQATGRLPAPRTWTNCAIWPGRGSAAPTTKTRAAATTRSTRPQPPSP